MGAVAFFPEDEFPLVFDGAIPDPIVLAWQKLAGKQIICQAELAAVVAIQDALKDRLRDRRIIFFIDNEFACFALIKGVNPFALAVPRCFCLPSVFMSPSL